MVAILFFSSPCLSFTNIIIASVSAVVHRACTAHASRWVVNAARHSVTPANGERELLLSTCPLLFEAAANGEHGLPPRVHRVVQTVEDA